MFAIVELLHQLKLIVVQRSADDAGADEDLHPHRPPVD